MKILIVIAIITGLVACEDFREYKKEELESFQIGTMKLQLQKEQLDSLYMMSKGGVGRVEDMRTVIYLTLNPLTKEPPTIIIMCEK